MPVDIFFENVTRLKESVPASLQEIRIFFDSNTSWESLFTIRQKINWNNIDHVFDQKFSKLQNMTFGNIENLKCFADKEEEYDKEEKNDKEEEYNKEGKYYMNFISKTKIHMTIKKLLPQTYNRDLVWFEDSDSSEFSNINV